MAAFDFGGLLGSDMFGGGDSGLEEYLTEEQRARMNNQGIMALAASLLKSSGPSAVPIGLGQALGEAYGAGQQGYQQAQTGAIANITARQKMDESKRALEMRKLYPTIFKQTDAGITIDPNKLQALTSLSSNPLEALASVSKLVPDLRRAGFLTTGMPQDNPFTIFSQDKTIPESLQRIASQYEKSYASGALDPDKVDERVRQLGQSIQTAQQYAQTASGLEQQRAAMQGLSQQSLALRQQAEANRPETFSYSQKKDFDAIQKTMAEAKSAEDSAFIADRAAPFISEAYTGKIEAGAKGLLGAVGISTTAKEANDRLTQLSQQLALKTPKFSGPTSDADTKRYDKAVGDLANPSVTQASKVQALSDIKTLAKKSADYAQQQENYYYENNKSLKGFKFTPSNPFGQ